MSLHDFAIAGAGIAGASLAAELAEAGASVIVLEAEERPGYHATGRSAAFWEECYGGPQIVPLTLASGPWLGRHGFLAPRGALYIGSDADSAELDDFIARFASTGATLERLGKAELRRRIPGIRHAWTGAVWEAACADIDVAALHAHFLARARASGAALACRARIVAAERSEGAWRIGTAQGENYDATTLVDAAGAWADELALLAGAAPLGIQPLRRTVLQLRTAPPAPEGMPLVLDIGGDFYFKPETGRVWLSPHDEVPSEPCDAAPEELAVAEAIARFGQVVDWRIEAVEHKWAGLRSFAPDRLPVYGWDARVEGFFWFAGQGGFGIQTSPAAARLAAQLLLARPRDSMTRDLDAALYSPARFA